MPGGGFEYRFPAIRGVQAQREYYVSMCPLPLIPKILLFDEEDLAPELRAQRSLNRNRIPEMTRYVVENPRDYVFSALTASVDGDLRFEAQTAGEGGELGILTIPMSARFIVNDGQHRRAAIQAALEQRPELRNETIAVVFFLDLGLRRSQQMFSDLNRHAIRPSRSLGLLYDHRDGMAQVARYVAIESEAFRGMVETERSTLSARSRKLFTLSAIYTATKSLLSLSTQDPVNVEIHAKRAVDFWDCVAKHIAEWSAVRDGITSAGEIRRGFIHSHAIALQAIGRAGNDLLQRSRGWKRDLGRISTIDWSRHNAKLWEGRAMIGGRISKASHNVVLTTNVIKKALKLDLSATERQIEAAYRRGEYATSD